MKTKKRYCLLLILVILSFVGISFMVGYIGYCYDNSNKKQLEYAKNTIKRDADVEIPDNSVLLFRDSDSGIHAGENKEYTVLLLNDLDMQWLEDNKFSLVDDENTKDLHKEKFINLLEHSAKMFKIPNEHVPKFDEDYYFMESTKRAAYFIYNPYSNKLIFFRTGLWY